MQSPCRDCKEQPEAFYLQEKKCKQQKTCAALQAFKEQAINQQGTQGGVVDVDLTYPIMR